MKDKILEALTSSQALTLYWTLANGLVLSLIIYINDINWIYAVPAIGVLNMITKSINKKSSYGDVY